MKAINPIAAWHDEHVYFGRLLKVLGKELDVFHGGERPNYELMLDIVSYLRDYGDLYHHPREDEAYARLARRRPELELQLARLKQEHRVIAQAGATLLERINAALQSDIAPRAELEMALATYLVYYGNHIAREEEDVLPHASTELSAEDWQAVKNAAPGGGEFREMRRRIALET